MLFQRKIYSELQAWKKDAQGSCALLIEGAAKVGKTSLVTEFAQNEYESYILVDFAFAPKHIQDLFLDMTDLDYFFLQLQLQYGVVLKERKSLIIFDEIQFNPKARQAIKILMQDGRYDYIETGSLISIKKNVADILLPSEERKIEMYPMDFEEFLWATNDFDTPSLLEMACKKQIALGDAQNRNMMKKLRLYMLVGGMPQAVLAYVEHNNLKIVDDVKRDIINLYMNDFFKIDETGKISSLFQAIPSELNKHGSGYQVSSVLPNQRYDSIKKQLKELIASKTVIPSYNVCDPSSPLSYMYASDKFRLYLADTGLLITLMFINKGFTDNIIYKKLLDDTLPVNMGTVYENMVAQMLAAKKERVFYHTFTEKDRKKNYEIDFLIAEKNGKISPVEVKSSGYKTHTSMDKFASKYSKRIGRKLLVYTKDFKNEQDVLYVPIYFVPWL